MAIHVRSTRRASRLWRELRRRLARLAAIVAIVFILVSGVTMYLIRIFTPPPPSASFVAWQEPPGGQEADEVQDTPRAASAAKPAQVDVQPVIITTADVLPLPEVVEIDFDDSEEFVDDFSLEVGSDLGDAMGTSGQGKGGGGSGGGRGSGKGMGYNDDVQVVLALDASGSMDRLFQAVANSLEELLRTLRECRVNGQPASVNVGIVVYGQLEGEGAPYELTPFTLELEKMRDKVRSVNCDGVYENCGEAIDFAVKHYPWNKRRRSRLLKVLFIAGNESFDQGSVNYRDALAAAREQGIIVNTIHCGNPNPEWRSAARMGGGEGLTFAMDESAANTGQQVPRGELIDELFRLPILPVGSPDEQAALREEYAKRPPLPDKNDENAVYAWSKQHLFALMRGSRNDAVELCRQQGMKISVDALGGRGNLPPELRGIADENQLVATVTELAVKRQELISKLRSVDSSSFISKVLDTLILQAAERGIDITR